MDRGELASIIREVLREELVSALDLKLKPIQESLDSLRNDMASNTIKVKDLEAAANETERRLTDIEQKLAQSQSQNVSLKLKIEQIEAHSRKFNIRVLGLPEDCEKGNPTTFMNSLLS